MDFTPFLAQLRADHALTAIHLRHQRQVLCLGSRILLSALVRAAADPGAILGAVTTEAEGLELVQRHRPDLLLVSDGLEQGCGVDLTLTVKRRHPQTRVLLLVTGNRGRSRAAAAIAAGCDGVLQDTALGVGGELPALRTIGDGGQVIDRSFRSVPNAGHRQPARLSLREQQVLEGIARGDNNHQIARGLILSPDTVKTHVSRLLVKLSARDRTHAVVRALQLGLLDLP